jgi:hypothetical protein
MKDQTVTETQPEARRWNDVVLKLYAEDKHMIYAVVHNPEELLHNQTMWMKRSDWEALERIG